MREIKPTCIFIRKKPFESSAEYFKAIKMIIEDDLSIDDYNRMKYELDNGEIISSKDCFVTTIPRIKEINDILTKYPDALEERACLDMSTQKYLIENFIKTKNEEIEIKGLLEELKFYQEKIKHIERLLSTR